MIKRLQEEVVIENGKIYITETDEDKALSVSDLHYYYKELAFEQVKNNKRWQNVIVENTDPPLEITINKKSIDEIFSNTAKHEDYRIKIISIQALPYFIQKMQNITPENNDKSRGKINVEYFYKAECQNVFINSKKYTITLKIIKRSNEENHKFYTYFINNLFIKKID
jgi:hypothetical protein